MTQFIVDAKTFENERMFVERIICPGHSLPDQVFRDLSAFTFLNFDEIFTDVFFEAVQRFLQSIGDKELTFFVIEPDAVNYFFHHFKKYPLVKFDHASLTHDYMSSLFEDPGGSPADAVAYNSSKLVVHSDSSVWALYGSRDFELGILAFANSELRDRFAVYYPRIFDVETAIENVLVPAWASSAFPTNFRASLFANYGA